MLAQLFANDTSCSSDSWPKCPCPSFLLLLFFSVSKVSSVALCSLCFLRYCTCAVIVMTTGQKRERKKCVHIFKMYYGTLQPRQFFSLVFSRTIACAINIVPSLLFTSLVNIQQQTYLAYFVCIAIGSIVICFMLLFGPPSARFQLQSQRVCTHFHETLFPIFALPICLFGLFLRSECGISVRFPAYDVF